MVYISLNLAVCDQSKNDEHIIKLSRKDSYEIKLEL